MNSEKIKKALRMAVNIGCGFEGDAEDAASLLSLIETNGARIAELEAAQRWHVVKECNDVATPIDVALRKRIAELEGKIDQLTAHDATERQDDKSPNDTQTQTVVYRKESEE